MEYRPNSNQPDVGYFTADSFRMQERYTTNNNKRIPICFCIDVSGSMGEPIGLFRGTRIQLLSDVMRRLLQALKGDPKLSERACVCIVTYNKYAVTVQDFLDVADVDPVRATSFRCTGQTRFSIALKHALREIDVYQKNIMDSDNMTETPILVFMTDGEPVGDGAQYIESVVNTIQRRTAEKQLHMLPVGISSEAQMGILVDTIRCMEDGRAYRMLKPEDFETVFEHIRSLINNINPDDVSGMASQQEDTQDTGSGQDMFFSMAQDFANDLF